MNAVVALCQFCEQHGPCVMFCCEKGGAPTVIPSESKLETVVEDSPLKENLPSSFAEAVISSNLSTPTSRKSSINKPLCQACKSLPDDHNGYVSYDTPAGEIFVSSQHPSDPNVFSKVRQACVRSLSCEVCPGKEGPIFFGDENDGYVLSYTFFIKDSMARGFQRLFSIIIVMMDRIYLIQSWPFLVESIRKIINTLQKSAVVVYNAELSEGSQRSSRSKLSFSSKSVTPSTFHSKRSTQSNARALVELTGDSDLYSYLHASFTWIMRACKLRWKETIPFIPPTFEQIRQPCKDLESDLHFQSLRNIRDILQPPRFRAVMWHLLIGNQVIWFGDKSVVVSAIRILKDVLPKGCAKCEEWSEICATDVNLIGMPNFTQDNKPWTKDYITIEVIRKRHGNIADANTVEVRLYSTTTTPEKGPSLLDKLEVALSNESLSNEVVQQCLLCLKQEWINKTRILHKFVSDKRNKEDTTHLLQDCLQCTDDDVKLLKFWLGGLLWKLW